MAWTDPRDEDIDNLLRENSRLKGENVDLAKYVEDFTPIVDAARKLAVDPGEPQLSKLRDAIVKVDRPSAVTR